MRRIVLLSLCSVFFFLSLTAQWTWQNPFPTGADLYSVKFINSTTGYISGDCGTVLKTTNGSSWTSCNTGTFRNLYSVFFTDDQSGCAVGASGIVLRTENGGDSWTANQAGSNDLLCVFFPTFSTGYASGIGATIYKTTDAGNSWDSIFQIQGHISSQVECLWFTSENTGYIGGFGIAMKTVDGGVTWQDMTTGYPYLWCYSMCFVNPDTGFMAGTFGPGKVLKTTDAGATWQEIFSSQAFYIEEISFATPLEGVVVGLYGKIAVTHNGGLTWNETTLAQYQYQSSVSYSNATNAYIVGSTGIILKTTNNCMNWTPLGSGIRFNLYGVSFINESVGFAVGNDPDSELGVIQRTFDGGNSWMPLLTASACYSVCALPDGTVFTGGVEIQRSFDLGNTWSVLTNPCYYPVRKLVFLDHDTGFAIDYSCWIFKTTDGGNTWIQTSPGSGSEIRSIFFPDRQEGFAIRSDGYVYKTTNMGNTWNFCKCFYSALNDIWFTDVNTGYIVGEEGFYAKTYHGGLTWTEMNSIGYSNFEAICFGDENTGYVVSQGGDMSGMIWKTDDAGLTWQLLQFRLSNTKYYDLYFTDDLHGWIVGLDGKIVNTTDGGVTEIHEKSDTSEDLDLTCFPNPSSGFVTISYSIPRASSIFLTFYNVLGRDLMHAAGIFQPAGKHTQTIETKLLQPGIYFCRLIAGNQMATQKIIIN